EGARLVHRLAETVQIAVMADQVQEIAVLAGGGVGPFAGGAGTGFGAVKPDIEAAARRIHDVAGDPVTAAAASVGEIVAAHRLGIAREAARQIAGLADHRASPRHAARARAPSSGWRSKI